MVHLHLFTMTHLMQQEHVLLLHYHAVQMHVCWLDGHGHADRGNALMPALTSLPAAVPMHSLRQQPYHTPAFDYHKNNFNQQGILWHRYRHRMQGGWLVTVTLTRGMHCCLCQNTCL